jgi:hypothetical protein
MTPTTSFRFLLNPRKKLHAAKIINSSRIFFNIHSLSLSRWQNKTINTHAILFSTLYSILQNVALCYAAPNKRHTEHIHTRLKFVTLETSSVYKFRYIDNTTQLKSRYCGTDVLYTRACFLIDRAIRQARPPPRYFTLLVKSG